MARIRTIKPDFWTNEKVMNSGALSRLLFIGMWNFADDYGRLHYAPLGIKAKIFPNDNFTVEEVRSMLDELRSNELLVIYTAEGKEYIEITGWDHQKIDKRQVSKIPGPFDAGSAVNGGSPPIPADPRRLPPTPAPVREGKGVEEEREYSEAIASGAVAPDPSIPQREYFLRGREVLGNKSGAMIANLLKAKGKNVALARAALEEASQKQSPMEFVAAICRGPPISAKPLTEFQRKQAETNDVRAQLKDLASRGNSSGTADRFLSHDSGVGSESLRGGPRPALFEVSGAPDRRGG